jgi:L-lactate dehydrogenase
VIAAGVNQKPGETRLELLQRNAAVFATVVPEVARHHPEGILVVATNPVDVLTYASLQLSGYAWQRVMGSGTILDTARFRHLLSRHFKVDPRSVHAYIIGEHGDSEVPVWSLANIAGMRLPEFCAAHNLAYDPAAMDDIFRQTRDAAQHIIARKGATYYAVAAGLMRIVEAIVRDQRTVLSVSSLVHDYYDIADVCLSLPTVVCRSGIEWVLHPQLSDKEVAALQHSAQVLKQLARASLNH